MRSWVDLTKMARNSGRFLMATDGCVSVYSSKDAREEDLTITTGGMALSNEDADRVCRAALEAALLELKAQDSRRSQEDRQVDRLTESAR